MIGSPGSLQQLVVGSSRDAPISRSLAFSAVGAWSVAATLTSSLAPTRRRGARVSLLFPLGCLGAILLRRRSTPALDPATGEGADRGMPRSSDGRELGLVAALVKQAFFLTIRSHYVRTFGIEATASCSRLAISQQVGSLFYAYSRATRSEDQRLVARRARATTHATLERIMLLAAAALLVTSLGASPLLRLLYSHRFDPRQPLIAWRLSAIRRIGSSRGPGLPPPGAPPLAPLRSSFRHARVAYAFPSRPRRNPEHAKRMRSRPRAPLVGISCPVARDAPCPRPRDLPRRRGCLVC